MNDEKDTPPEGVTPMPVASPQHPMPPRRSTTREVAIDAVLQGAKRAKARKPLNYTLISAVVAALASGVVTGLKKSSDTKATLEDRVGRLERKVRQLSRRHDALQRAVPLPVEEPPEEKDDPP